MVVAVRELRFIDGIMNAQMYCEILKEKILPSLHALGHWALFHHRNDQKQSSKVIGLFLRKTRVKVAKHVTRPQPNRTLVGTMRDGV